MLKDEQYNGGGDSRSPRSWSDIHPYSMHRIEQRQLNNHIRQCYNISL